MPKRDFISVPDFRSKGTMTQFVRDLFHKADRGYSRDEIREVLRGEPRFMPLIARPRSGHTPVINTLLKRREIVEVGGILYRQDQAPRVGYDIAR